MHRGGTQHRQRPERPARQRQSQGSEVRALASLAPAPQRRPAALGNDNLVRTGARTKAEIPAPVPHSRDRFAFGERIPDGVQRSRHQNAARGCDVRPVRLRSSQEGAGLLADASALMEISAGGRLFKGHNNGHSEAHDDPEVSRFSTPTDSRDLSHIE